MANQGCHISTASWANTSLLPKRKQAEFLVEQFVPFDLIQSIGVYDSRIKAQVQAVFAGFSVPVPVTIQRDWYY